MLDRLLFMFSEAFVAIRRNWWMNFAAITTVAVSLFFIGGLGFTYNQIQKYADTLPGKFEMRAFLKTGVTPDDFKATADKIRAFPEVAEVTLIPKEGAWDVEKKKHPELTEGLDNPFPDAFKIKIRRLNQSDEIAAKIGAMSEVEPGGVKYLKDEQRFVDEAMHLIRWLGAVFGGLLLFTGGILIYNAIRLAVEGRRTEIRIMRLVGASRPTIFVPFVLEGLFQGVVGGCVATGLIIACHKVITNFVQTINPQFVIPVFPMQMALGWLCAIGASYGFICSILAVRAPLREQ